MAMVHMVAIRQIFGDGVNVVPEEHFYCTEEQALHYGKEGLAEEFSSNRRERPKYKVYETKVVVPGGSR